MKKMNEEVLEKLDNFLNKPLLDSYNDKDTKKVKSDRGLIERVKAESQKIVLTEENKMLLND